MKYKENLTKKLFTMMQGRRSLYVIGLFGTSSFMFVFNLIAAYVLKRATDAALQQSGSNMINSVLFMMAGIMLIVLISPFLKYMYQSIYIRSTGTLKKNLFDHILDISMDYHETHQSGEFISKFNNDVTEVKEFYGDRLCNLLTALISGIGSGIMIFSLNWKLGVTAVVLGLANVSVDKSFSRGIREKNQNLQEANANSTQIFSNIIDGFSTVKFFNLRSEMGSLYKATNEDIYNKSMKLNIMQAVITGLNTLFGSMSFIGVLGIGCFIAYKQEITPGVILAVIQLQNGLNMMFETLGQYIVDVQRSFASAERVLEILENPAEVEKWSTAGNDQAVAAFNPHITFDHVNFSYKNRDFQIRDITFEANREETVALVGSSGSGKSTLLKLLLKFYNVDQGYIEMNGKPLKEYPVDEIRNYISYVQQENYLFNGTIAENIGYGKKGASREEIVKAAKLAYADEFIQLLPEKYDTIVGENGVQLSGGQKQRITIARAFLKNAPILLLDEATSALDSDSESKIQKALGSLMEGRTTIVTAHRLSTIMRADKIYVLEDGKIMESGTHDELIKKAGIYKKFYDLQFDWNNNACNVS